MPYLVFEPDIEILGTAINATIDGFGPFKTIVHKLLTRGGLATQIDECNVAVDVDAWYPQQAWLDTLREVDERFGNHVLFKIGHSVPNNAVFPPDVVDVQSALASIDVAYHLNHRRQGQVMFDPQTGTMIEGIGHYGYEQIADRHVRIRAWTPYPCRFDHGIVTAMARRFAQSARIEHAGECRHDGAEACDYLVRWPS